MSKPGVALFNLCFVLHLGQVTITPGPASKTGIPDFFCSNVGPGDLIFTFLEQQQQKNNDFEGLLPQSEAALFGYSGHLAIITPCRFTSLQNLCSIIPQKNLIIYTNLLPSNCNRAGVSPVFSVRCDCRIFF